ncbi:MAG: hypothetical protein ACAH59_11550 [Pseudobdellovibrionaceae bacterium]
MKTSLFLSLSLFIFLAGCSPENPDYYIRRDLEQEAPPKEHPKVKQEEDSPAPVYPEPEVPKFPPLPEPKKMQKEEIKWIQIMADPNQLELNPKVDILFIEDNSGSMKEVQANLAKNINRFASAFQQKIDFRVAVLSVWDSSAKFVNNPKRKYDIGELRRVREANGAQSEKRFLTRSMATPAALSATINIGIASSTEAMPEFEEIFSTLEASIKRPENLNPNTGFFRPDARLVVIMVSDAEDSTSKITPEQLAQDLVDFKGGQAKMVSAYGVLVRKGDNDLYKDFDLKRHPNYHPECFDMTNPKNPVRLPNLCKEGFGPERLDQFIVAANSGEGTPEMIKSKFILKLVQPDFGKDLAQIGSSISEKTMEKEILLDQRPRAYPNQPDRAMVKVFFGNVEIPENDGWAYDPEDNSVRLSGKINYSKYSQDPKARFRVELVPVTLDAGL